MPRTRSRPPLLPGLVLALGTVVATPTPAQLGNEAIAEARELLQKKDGRARLPALRDRLVAERHPLALWVDYWELSGRLPQAEQTELDAFYERWSGTYVEDRLRNDWLLELGRRRDWTNFARDHTRYRMRDDREVACYALMVQHLAGTDVRAAAVAAWHAQRDLDDGCHLLASTLVEAKRIGSAEVWQEMRLSVEANRPRAARAAAALVGPGTAKAVAELLDKPQRYLHAPRSEPSAQQRELAVLAALRLAGSDPDAAAAALDGGWARALDDAQAAAAWAGVGKQAALKHVERAFELYQLAWKRQRDSAQPPRWSDDTHAWGVRAALRGARLTRERWAVVELAIDAMTGPERFDPAWAYWRARALQARARTDAEREQAQAQLKALAAGLGFYPMLAAQDLAQPLALPPAPPPLADAELEQAAATPGLQRGLLMARIGLRDEGRREWNFTLRGLGDRELLAAAQLACRVSDWQLCINTSERTREQIELRQRYPMPYAAEVTARALERGLDPALVFGLIRQETRFMATLRSSAGAIGLMQLMPATARWTARKIGVDLKTDAVTDVDTNLKLGTTYLKLLLDDFAGSQAMAAAAYNAGPGRPRRWREGPPIEAAAWAENIPFNETRDYVKKVLGNAMVYAQLIEGRPPVPLKSRLGSTIGPRDAGSAPPDPNLP